MLYLCVRDTNWVHLAWDTDWWRAVVKTVMNLYFLYNDRNFLAGWATVSIAMTHLHRYIIIYV